jgi:Caspase domain
MSPALLVLGVVLAAQAPVAGHALIVTNNRSLDPQRPNLQFADDDGAQYASLFGQLFGEEQVALLTTFDAASAQLQPHWAQRAVPPTRAQLELAVARLARQLAAEHAAGTSTVAVLVFAGHGDLDNGKGFLELEDGRLTAAELENEVVARLPADRIHLVLDSCNSYFMLSPRKPGGRRWSAPSAPGDGLLGRWPKVGAVVSTSAEAVTYEWSELQSGIFSYEVRSGLRGGADADGDGRITYAELAAFISVANQHVPNDLYRPKVFARGPGGAADEVFLDLRAATGRRLEVPAGPAGHRLTLRNQLGVRVADLHTEPEATGAMLLPAEPVLSLTEAVPLPGAEGRTVLAQLVVPDDDARLRLDALSADPAPLVARGELPVFRSLFEAPFGPRAFAALREQVARDDPASLPQGVTQLDVDRLRVHLGFMARADEVRRATAGLSFGLVGAATVGAALAPGGLGTGDDATARVALGTAGAVLVLAGVAATFWPTDAQRLDDAWSRLDLSTEAARATAVVDMEGRFQRAAEAGARQRLIGGLTGAGAGLLLGGLGVAQSLLHGTNGSGLGDVLEIGAGVVELVLGLYQAFFNELPIEQAWRFYLRDSRLGDGPAPSRPAAVTFVPSVGVSPSGQVLLGLGGRF